MGYAAAQRLRGERKELVFEIAYDGGVFLVNAAIADDQDDVMLLQQRKINLGKQITGASASRQVNRAYASAAYGKRNSQMDVSK